MSDHHTLMGGKLHVYKRENSNYWQCSTYLGGKNRRASTGFENLDRATEFAEEWYIELRGKAKVGALGHGPLFKTAAAKFLEEYEIITQGNRNPRWVKCYDIMLRVHILPFFGKLTLSEVTSGKLQEYRIHRRKTAQERIGRPPSRTAMHHETVAIRQVLKTAMRHGWLSSLPDFSQPYMSSGKIVHRAWFSPDEYKQLYEATRRRAQNPPHPKWKWSCEQMHDFVLFMANTGLRPDEALRLQFRDVAIVEDYGSKETILEIEVRGKRGVGFCKSTAQAVTPFRRLQERLRLKPKGLPSPSPQGEPSNGRRSKGQSIRNTKGMDWAKPSPTDLVFPSQPRELLNTILEEEELKHDRDNNVRTAYSLRHTYICFRLMEGADIYQIAKNCRTSVEMIEKFYAAHIKTTLDATAINTMRGTIGRERRRKRENQPVAPI